MKFRWTHSSGGFFARLWVWLTAPRAKWVLYHFDENGERNGRLRIWCVNPDEEDYALAESQVAALVSEGWKLVLRPR